jgi:hypothetical protein
MARNPLYSIFWLLVLIFIAWPVAMACAGAWILLQVSLVAISFRKNSTALPLTLTKFFYISLSNPYFDAFEM